MNSGSDNYYNRDFIRSSNNGKKKETNGARLIQTRIFGNKGKAAFVYILYHVVAQFIYKRIARYRLEFSF